MKINWCPRELEALAIIWACEQLRPYIIGSTFIIETEQWLKEAKTPARLVRWSLRLSEFDYIIKHKKGKANGNADRLSRLPIEGNTEIDALESYLLMAETNDNPEE